MLNMRKKDEIVPSLRTIINQFDEENQRPSYTFSCGQKTTESFDISHNNEDGYADDDDGYENFGTSFDYDGQSGAADENLGPNDAEPVYSNFHEVLTITLLMSTCCENLMLTFSLCRKLNKPHCKT